MINVSEEVLKIKSEVINNRRYLHQYPELAFEERNTAKFICQKLEEYGLKFTSGIAKTGIISLFDIGAAKTLLLRADMDGLPIQEQNTHEYASKTKNVMHACGHDGHVAMLLGIAKLLPALKNKLKVNIKLMFQPAEESPGGALPMIKEGILENPKVDYAFALHLWNELEVGTVGIKEGPIMACGDKFELEILGKGGHGAAPHIAKDPTIVLAHIINAFQTVVSRLYSPFEPLALSFGTINGGYAFNVIPDKIKVSGTFRTFNTKIREEIPTLLEKIAKSIASSWDINITFSYTPYYPPTVNDKEVARKVKEIVNKFLPSINVNDTIMLMGAEDFSYILQRVPGCYIFIGSKNQQKGYVHPHHSPYFDFDEEALLVGIELLKNIIVNWE
jgi:amidohydrolase